MIKSKSLIEKIVIDFLRDIEDEIELLKSKNQSITALLDSAHKYIKTCACLPHLHNPKYCKRCILLAKLNQARGKKK